MAYDPAEPAHGSGLLSAPVRNALQAIAAHHVGATPPTSAQKGWFFLDESDPANIRLSLFYGGAWHVFIANITGGAITPVGLGKYEHTQASALDTWVVDHNLDTTTPIVAVWSGTDQAVIPDNIVINNANRLTITFLVPQAGRACVVG